MMPNALIEIVEEKINGDEEKLKMIINQYGPVATAMHATPELMAYGGGVYLNDMCSKEVNHAVVSILRLKLLK
jgi:Papain family cysteine protease